MKPISIYFCVYWPLVALQLSLVHKIITFFYSRKLQIRVVLIVHMWISLFSCKSCALYFCFFHLQLAFSFGGWCNLAFYISHIYTLYCKLAVDYITLQLTSLCTVFMHLLICVTCVRFCCEFSWWEITWRRPLMPGGSTTSSCPCRSTIVFSHKKSKGKSANNIMWICAKYRLSTVLWLLHFI